jgi:DNA-binding response OmpR family regulator
MSKILLVEDDPLVSNIYRNKLCVEGFEADAALDGETGLEMLRSFRPDAVILDLMLPKMSGVDLIKRIRAEPGCERLPVIVFSNTYLSSKIEQAWKAGATKCLSKANCTPRQLIDSLHHALAKRQDPAPGPQSPEPPPEEGPAPDEAEGDAIESELRQSLAGDLPANLAELRAAFQAAVKSDREPARLKALDKMLRRVHGLSAGAGLTGRLRLARMATAFEALLAELIEKPPTINASSLRTAASAIDCLDGLCRETHSLPEAGAPPGQALVVDDEVISRRAVNFALGKIGLKALSLDNSGAALEALVRQSFDLIILDVDMPGINGFELCAKLRELPRHKSTPVVFVTGLTDLESRAQSSISGGNDFIAKPFLFMELAVKALIYLLRPRPAPGRRTF